jgi:hypothetical protein
VYNGIENRHINGSEASRQIDNLMKADDEEHETTITKDFSAAR